MKKLICIIAALCVVLTLFGCSAAQISRPADKYVRGGVEGDTWESQWLGLSYTLAEDFVFTTEQQLQDMMEITPDTIHEDENGFQLVDYSLVDSVYEMMAYHEDGSNVVVISEMNKAGLSEQEYMNYVRLEIVQLAMEYTFTELYDFQIGDVTLKRCDGSTYAYGDFLCQTYLLIAKGDRIISIQVTAPQKDTIDKIIASFR